DEWKAEMDKLKAQADKAEAEARLEYYKQIDELQNMQNEAYRKLVELRKASDDAWDDLRAGVEVAWDSLSDAMKAAASRFR
ncbi:MAG: coiled coil domain-containing protein, partial [Gammaproteobacteria bacterium]